ncbi:MAG: hypothetical protein HY474_01600 [Candidatus Sungbacteria bacterium]|uniref:Uncharacterized protein n=1 Tax=Candidatus Sungiibacteriota bacterium TaxID=2750080 RepID=A0A932YYH1_9BACT|nr:hypothetical protein [Candidatus Sungbacteria bacterium]
MVQQVSLNDRMRNVLLAAATEMMRQQGEKGAGRRRVKDDDIEGLLETQFRISCLGPLAGIEFRAEVETDLGKGKVKFIVDALLTDDLKRGQWVDVTDHLRKAEAAVNN